MAPKYKESKLEAIVVIISISLLLAHLLASFFPTARSWGIHHLLFFSLPVRLVIVSVGILVCVPRVNQKIMRKLGRICHWVLKRCPRAIKQHFFLALSVIFFIPFWFWRIKTHFLGDGYLRIRSLPVGQQFKMTELLDLLFHTMIYQIFKRAGEVDVATTYALVSSLGGVIFVFVLLLLSNFLGKDRLKATLIFLLIISMGTMQLFFGYVESYTLLTIGILIYILFSCYYLDRRCSIVFPSLVLSLTICSHFSAVALLPSLIYLYFASTKRDRWKSRFIHLAQMGGAFLIPILLLAGLASLSGLVMGDPFKEPGGTVFLPLVSTTEGPTYTLFSLVHLVDMVNEQLLVSPVGLVICFLVLFFYRRKVKFTEPLVKFLIIASGFYLLLTFILNPKLGLSRDWDLLSFPSIPYTLFGAYLLVNCVKERDRLKSVGLILTAVALVHSVPWILVNADVDKGIRRFKLLLETKTVRSQWYAYEDLAIYYRDRGMWDEAIEEYKKAIRVSPSNARLRSNLGSAYRIRKIYDEAIQQYKKAIAIDPEYSMAHYYLGHVYMDKKMYDEAIQQFKAVIAIDPKNLAAHLWLGLLYQEKNLYDQAIQKFKEALILNPDFADAHFALGCIYAQQRRWLEAKSEWEKTLELNPYDQRAKERLLDLLAGQD